MISVVIPTLDSERLLGPTLGSLAPGLMEGMIREVIFADGGSTDETEAIAEAVGARFLAAPPDGRRAAGAAAAKGAWLMFLEPGAVLAPGWPAPLKAHATLRPDRPARFRRRSGGGPGARLAAASGNLSAALGLGGGDGAVAVAAARLRAAPGALDDDRRLRRALAKLRPAALAASVEDPPGPRG